MPLPLRNSADTFDSLIQQLLKQKQFSESLKQKKQEDEELKKYREYQIAQTQAEEYRKQQMFPYLLKKAQIEQQGNEHAYNDLFGEKSGNTTEKPNFLPDENKSILESFMQSGNASPEDVSQIQQFIKTQNNPQQPTVLNRPPMKQEWKNLVSTANQDTDFFRRQQLQQPINSINQSSELNQNNINFKPKSFSELQSQLKNGQEIIVKDAEPSKVNWDKYAGQERFGVKIPELKTNITDGIQYTRYPSGMVKAVKVGPSEQEKIDLSVESAQKKEESKINIKQSNDLVNEGRLVSKFAHNISGLAELLDKKENKDISGYKESIKKLLGQGSEYSGEFSSYIAPLVGGLAKEMSKQGGAVVSKLAQASKPQLYQTWEYNKSLVNSLLKDTYRGWKDLKENYERLNPGKVYPEKLPKFFDKVRIKDPSGNTYIQTEENAIKFKKEHPELEILGNIYDEQ